LARARRAAPCYSRSVDFCIDPDDLERYALRNLSETEAAALEEHPLICLECQDRLHKIPWGQRTSPVLG